ncbi:hypothetical protein R5R35_001121 [Gryllus longicercus]|uniref:Uncharacterized protein n=1 Tax=Gryllus longicercus TaxID=2509291 RepID=A0AAN9Z7P2_9ORTH
MFEPRAFDEKAQGQDALIGALLSRDMKAFEEALADPDVDPNHWYGKPYWSTCLQLAARSEGCEAFVLALLRAGAGDLRYRSRPRPSDAAPRFTKLIAEAAAGDAAPPLNGDLHDFLSLLLAAPPGACVCGAQAATAAAAAAAAAAGADAGARAAAGPEDDHGGGGGGGGEVKPEHVLGLWLREMSRALRDTAEHMRRELRAVAERVEQLAERVAAVERAQQRTNDILLHATKR